jgi:hypothetical protein
MGDGTHYSGACLSDSRLAPHSGLQAFNYVPQDQDDQSGQQQPGGKGFKDGEADQPKQSKQTKEYGYPKCNDFRFTKFHDILLL